MRAKVVNLNELNIKKHKVKLKVKCFQSRTTLILDRCCECSSSVLYYPLHLPEQYNANVDVGLDFVPKYAKWQSFPFALLHFCRIWKASPKPIQTKWHTPILDCAEPVH